MRGAPAPPPIPLHPYYPLGVAIPNYQANSASVPVLLVSLGGMLASVLVAASTVALRVNPSLTKANLALFCWFVLCGSLHCFFEGYFVFNHDTVASSQNLFAQLWKEYALSDSRYLTSDPFMLSVESITVFLWGPLSFACAASIVLDSYLRHPAQIVMCIAHLYGVALYYSTSLVETHFTHLAHSRPEFLYFWVYYVGFNLPWAVVPAYLLFDSVTTLRSELRILDSVRTGLAGFQAHHTPLNSAKVPEEPKDTKEIQKIQEIKETQSIPSLRGIAEIMEAEKTGQANEIEESMENMESMETMENMKTDDINENNDINDTKDTNDMDDTKETEDTKDTEENKENKLPEDTDEFEEVKKEEH
ncbi:EBDP2 [Apiospora rasikravindrae]|uniref:EBDP2 n=1 Tax=Apiospora rasikravindrae TaxID=990691 RepID=A0ABR1UCK2_9PEZI